MTLNIVTSFLRLIFDFDEIEPIIGSKNAKAELIPAKSTAKKNNGAKMCPMTPIKLNIFGNTTNISPVPSLTNCTRGVPDVADIYPRIEKTPNAVKISKLEFDKTTKNTLSVRPLLSDR